MLIPHSSAWVSVVVHRIFVSHCSCLARWCVVKYTCLYVCIYVIPIYVLGRSAEEERIGRTKNMFRREDVTSGYKSSSSRLMAAITLPELSLAPVNGLCRRSGPSSTSLSRMSGSAVVQPSVKSSRFYFKENVRICRASMRG